jgi:hypothetical protein
MEKIFNHKSFYYLVWTPLGSRVNLKYIFAFKFTLRSQQPNIVPIYLLFAAGIVDTGGKFAAGINTTSETGGKI